LGPQPQIEVGLEEEDTIVKEGPLAGLDSKLVKVATWVQEVNNRDRAEAATGAADPVVPPDTVEAATASPQALVLASACVPSPQAADDGQDQAVAPSCSASSDTSTGGQGPATAPPCPTDGQGPAIAPPCPATDRSPPSIPPGQLPLRPQDVIAMAWPFWFDATDGPSRTVSAVLQQYVTTIDPTLLWTHAEWAHAGRRDLALHLLHRISSGSRDGQSADVILQDIWKLLSLMQD